MDSITSSSAGEARRRLSDALARVGGGSESALQEVYSNTSAKLFGLILRILGDRGEAEDALQEVYVSVWCRAGSFDPSKASPVTWLAAIARNRAIDRLRASGRPRPAEPIESARDIADTGDDALTQLEAGEERARLNGCVEELETRQASAIRSAFFGGLSYPELAERAEVPLGTMKSWVRRGLLRLRDCLER
ncbi:MAG TPA: sigma-70 family RNA polymerase sigma factor [Allosphingosinicella sp.]|jgi:RNA polymerase sigma-70 factor (ECF subfamily)|nr:sigma-70 family RNA polymerase sigma factor [Allosphingosinicella sp.]